MPSEPQTEDPGFASSLELPPVLVLFPHTLNQLFFSRGRGQYLGTCLVVLTGEGVLLASIGKR